MLSFPDFLVTRKLGLPAGRRQKEATGIRPQACATIISMKNIDKLARFILKKRIGDPHFVYSVDIAG